MSRPKPSRFEPVAETVTHDAPTERSASDRQKQRQQALYETLQRARLRHIGDGPPPIRSFREGLIVIIATYNDNRPLLDPSARINTIHHLLLALEHQRPSLPEAASQNFKVVIADNGLSPDQRSRLQGYFSALEAKARASDRVPPSFFIVSAPKIRGDDFTRTAGYARNMALREIRRRCKAGDRSFDVPVLIHDDDAVTDGIGDMYRLLSRHRNVLGAVAPVVLGVRDMALPATHIRSRRYGVRLGTSAQSSSYPPVFDRDGLINFSVLFAFGGSRIPKTCALMLHPRALDDLRSEEGDIFHVWKKGSFEDMCCSIGLACSDWDVFSCGSARAYDQVRNHPEARLRQQFAWGYDHATAFHDFSEVSELLAHPVVHRGVSVLVPLPKEERTQTEGWGLQRMVRLRGFPGLQATIARPEEVLELLAYIQDQLSTPLKATRFRNKHSYAFEGGLETLENLRRVVRTVRKVLKAVLAQLVPDRFHPIEVPFNDHQRVYSKSGEGAGHAEALRFARDTRVARLLGNLASLFRNPMNDFRQGQAKCIVFGPRQAT
ncbi:MAG TPA: glycosyltransferase family A protein [Candidatus Limnocylindria bacterium]|jgi:hypothetical protein|nr:glycosyltransferase family A protein [Candidatus Limnocylindria bacterium]